MTRTLWSDCRECNRRTKHTVLSEKSHITPPEDYHSETKYFFLECNGCETISFRTEFHDYEQFRQIGPDDYEHPITAEIFPHFINGHNGIESLHDLPVMVRNIYKESLLAVQENAFTLAGLGLRATIEAVCNDKDIKGGNLQIRINAMNRSGMISKSDTERLHAIRFMGNDAAHEIKKAKEKSVLIALKIIEHLLLSVYVFEEEVNLHLEKPIANIDEAIPILISNLNKMQPNNTFTFSKWLGKSKRRILEKIDEIEVELIAKINRSEIAGVRLALPPEAGSEKESQWYTNGKIEGSGLEY